MATVDLATVRNALTGLVPFVRVIGPEFLEYEEGRALLRQPDRPELHNHVGGPHAGVLFSLAETASGAVLIGTFMDRLSVATPLAVGADIRYLKLAQGDITAEAVLSRPAADVRAELADGKRPEFDIAVTMRRADGETVAEMTVRWTLRPNR
jgi:acyl-coenzyme A thioesterase PaaI-like protein